MWMTHWHESIDAHIYTRHGNNCTLKINKYILCKYIYISVNSEYIYISVNIEYIYISVNSEYIYISVNSEYIYSIHSKNGYWRIYK